MASKKLKHQKWLNELSIPCPPSNFIETERIAFRWVFNLIENEVNFLPQFFKNKKRFNNKPADVKCESLGLSLYNTEKNARNRFNELKELMAEKAYKKLGNSIAKGTLLANDGVSNSINKRGHFTFFVYEDIELQNKFVISSKL